MLTFVLILFVLFWIVTLFLLGKIVFGTIKKSGKWGINFSNVNCPRCGERMPSVRQPQSKHQALWGGWNCPKCGCELDKWGKEISAVADESSTPPRQLEESKIEPIKPFDERGKTPVERIFDEDDK